MYDFKLPDYKGKGIVNLMSSIARNFGKKHEYAELSSLNSKELKKFKNIVLVVIDGLGYNYLKKQKNSFLLNNLEASMTSTFLATTACANTTFLTGYPAQQHGLIGRDINLKEVGAIVSILSFTPRFGGKSLSDANFDMNKILNAPVFHKGFKAKCFTVLNQKLVNSPFNNCVSKETTMISARSYKNTFTKIQQLIKTKTTKRRFIHAYISDIDAMMHKKGVGSKEVSDLFFDIDCRIKNLAHSIKDSDTKLIITADHGLIDTSETKQIWVEDIKGMKDCLTIPVAGESRVIDCFVRPKKVNIFEEIVNTKLSKYCWCFKGEELIKNNFYGLGKPNKKLLDRVGDYVLIMKENYVLRDKLANHDEHRKFGKGQHGGVSEEEMIVPLVIVDC